MPPSPETSKAANQPVPHEKPWLSRRFKWIGRKKEQEPKDAPKDYPPPPIPLSLNRKNNNRKDFHPASTRNASGMFYRLVNTGMDPYEARELLVRIMKDSDEPKTRTSTEEDAEKAQNRRVHFLDEVYFNKIYRADQPPEVETTGDPPPRLELGDGFGEERFREMFGEFVEGDDEEEDDDDELDDVGYDEIGRKTPGSAYSKESRLLCERYVPAAAAAE